jgi:hypothetical protein
MITNIHSWSLGLPRRSLAKTGSTPNKSPGLSRRSVWAKADHLGLFICSHSPRDLAAGKVHFPLETRFHSDSRDSRFPIFPQRPSLSFAHFSIRDIREIRGPSLLFFKIPPSRAKRPIFQCQIENAQCPTLNEMKGYS